MHEEYSLFTRAAELAAEYVAGLGERPVARPVDLAALRQAFGEELPRESSPPEAVIEELARIAEEGLVATRVRGTSGWSSAGP